jgi:cGMP-dependent protein kinase
MGAGFLPFGMNADDPFEIYEDIVERGVALDGWEPEGRGLLEQLLSKKPEGRLGGSYSALKTN